MDIIELMGIKPNINVSPRAQNVRPIEYNLDDIKEEDRIEPDNNKKPYLFFKKGKDNLKKIKNFDKINKAKLQNFSPENMKNRINKITPQNKIVSSENITTKKTRENTPNQDTLKEKTEQKNLRISSRSISKIKKEPIDGSTKLNDTSMFTSRSINKTAIFENQSSSRKKISNKNLNTNAHNSSSYNDSNLDITSNINNNNTNLSSSKNEKQSELIINNAYKQLPTVQTSEKNSEYTNSVYQENQIADYQKRNLIQTDSNNKQITSLRSIPLESKSINNFKKNSGDEIWCNDYIQDPKNSDDKIVKTLDDLSINKLNTNNEKIDQDHLFRTDTKPAFVTSMVLDSNIEGDNKNLDIEE